MERYEDQIWLNLIRGFIRKTLGEETGAPHDVVPQMGLGGDELINGLIRTMLNANMYV